jgi:L-iditol 2-dehydrogenase
MLSTTQIVLTGPGRAEPVRRRLEPLRPGQALIRVTQCGVCGSEVDKWLGAGSYPAEIGHEVAGVVEGVAADAGGRLAVGDHVVSWVTGGGVTEFAAVEARHALRIPPGLGFPAAAEPLACCVNAVELAAPRLGAHVVIIGSGFMSRLIERLSALKGARSITVAGRRAEALDGAADRPATRLVNLRTQSLDEAVAEATGGAGADVVYEATGTQGSLDLAGQVTRVGGTIAITGYHQAGRRTIDLGRWNERAYRIANAHFRDIEVILGGMRTAVGLVESGRLDPADLLTHRFPLTGVDRAFRVAAERPKGFVKAVIEPHGGVG